ncbi:MAG TPA: type IV toxin-antitoxin system AbiEi family antitoxin [bacterium]|nr:type IV toxin-antitoxin system AbiEi family antitoxin [bacterium]
MKTQRQNIQSLAPKLPVIFRPRNLEEQGVSRDRLRGFLRRGEVERIGRGLYRAAKASAGADANESLAIVCARAPRAVVCLLTALRFHGIGTQTPRAVWIAISRASRKPVIPHVPVRVVRFSPAMLRYGIEMHTIQGVEVRITSPARTVVDLFRYRKKLGIDVAIEALKDAVASKRVRPQDLRLAAEAGRVAVVMRPYLEAIYA